MPTGSVEGLRPPTGGSSPPSVPDALAALVVRPGDRVLLEVDAGFSLSQIDHVRETLTERFPGVEFTFLAGVHVSAIEHGDAPAQ